MMGHKICFSEEIWPIIPKLSLLLLLIWSPVFYGRQQGLTDALASAGVLSYSTNADIVESTFCNFPLLVVYEKMVHTCRIASTQFLHYIWLTPTEGTK